MNSHTDVITRPHLSLAFFTTGKKKPQATRPTKMGQTENIKCCHTDDPERPFLGPTGLSQSQAQQGSTATAPPGHTFTCTTDRCTLECRQGRQPSPGMFNPHHDIRPDCNFSTITVTWILTQMKMDTGAAPLGCPSKWLHCTPPTQHPLLAGFLGWMARRTHARSPALEPILYWRFLFVIEETAHDGLAANCVQMYVAAPPLERAGVSGCPAQPACATLPTRVRGTR